MRTAIGHTPTVEWITEVVNQYRLNAINIIHVDHELWNAALALLKRYDDKPDISFVDFTSFAVMQKHRIVEVFTGDRHFEQVNLGLRILR